MQEIKFNVGSKAQFLKFFNKIGEDDKIALLTHTDLDGLASAKVVSGVVSVDVLKFINYTDVNLELVEDLKGNGITKVIFTDIAIEDEKVAKALEEFAEVLIIDHHVVRKDLNSDKIVFINMQGFCGAYICYLLFSEIKNLEELDWLVACACVADFQYFENSKFMKDVYVKYSEKFDNSSEGIKQSKFWDRQLILSKMLIYFDGKLSEAYNLVPSDFEGVESLGKYSDIIDKEIEKNIKLFGKNRKEYGDLYYWEFNPKYRVKSFITNILSKKQPNKTFLFVSPQDNKMTISIRRQDRSVNTPKLLEKLISGFENSGAGGHIPASGGHFPKKYLKEFRKRVANLG